MITNLLKIFGSGFGPGFGYGYGSGYGFGYGDGYDDPASAGLEVIEK